MATAREESEEVDISRHLVEAALAQSHGKFAGVLLRNGNQLFPQAFAARNPDALLTFYDQTHTRLFTLPARLRDADLGSAAPVLVPSTPGLESLLLVPICHEQENLGALYLEIEASLPPLTVGQLCALATQSAARLVMCRLHRALEREVALRKQAEESLRETHNALLKHQQIGRMGDFRFNIKTGESFGSTECYKLFGFDPALETISFDVWTGTIVPDDRERIIATLSDAVAKRRPIKFEYRIELNGEIRWIEATGGVDEGTPDFYYGVVADVTERHAVQKSLRSLQTELESALRLASIGELAGSIIHEINQPLAAIMTNAEAAQRWLLRETPDLAEAGAVVAGVVREARRAAGVVSSLHNLVRGTRLQASELQLNDVLRDVLELARQETENARIATPLLLDEAIPTIVGDRVQLQQVVFNLLRNAIDAVREVSERPRVVTVSSKRTKSGEIGVAIQDVGPRVEVERVAKLFEAFFTTKPDGLGLGLSISRKIIRAHGGHIWATQNPEFGLTFRFVLPLGPGQAQRGEG